MDFNRRKVREEKPGRCPSYFGCNFVSCCPNVVLFVSCLRICGAVSRDVAQEYQYQFIFRKSINKISCNTGGFRLLRLYACKWKYRSDCMSSLRFVFDLLYVACYFPEVALLCLFSCDQLKSDRCRMVLAICGLPIALKMLPRL